MRASAPSTIAAEDSLHDLGAISMIGSDSPGDGARRRDDHPHLADRARDEAPARALVGPPSVADNLRAQRYVAKYTICPALAHGLDGEIGSVEVGKLADLVLWDPAFFAVRPDVVVKGGMIAWAPMGDAERLDPDARSRCSAAPMFGAAPAVPRPTSLSFVAPAALDDGLADRLARARASCVPVADIRALGKADLPQQRRDCREIEVDPRHVHRRASTAS